MIGEVQLIGCAEVSSLLAIREKKSARELRKEVAREEVR